MSSGSVSVLLTVGGSRVWCCCGRNSWNNKKYHIRLCLTSCHVILRVTSYFVPRHPSSHVILRITSYFMSRYHLCHVILRSRHSSCHVILYVTSYFVSRHSCLVLVEINVGWHCIVRFKISSKPLRRFMPLVIYIWQFIYERFWWVLLSCRTFCNAFSIT